MRGECGFATFSSHAVECESAGTAWDPTNGKTVVSFWDISPGFSPSSDLKPVFDSSVAENTGFFPTLLVW